MSMLLSLARAVMRSIGALGSVLALALALGSCALPLAEPAPPEGSPPVWPEAPDEPRIAFVGSIERSSDLGIEKGFFERVLDFVLGARPDRLVRPSAVLEVDNVLYVADPGARGVHRFVRGEKGRYDLIGAEGGAGLPSPVALARGVDGDVYVTDSVLGGVFLIRPQAQFAVPVRMAGGLGQPTGIAFDPLARRLYVADTTAHQIKVFTPEGALVRTLGRRGEGDGEFNFPTMIWCSPAANRLFVTDSLNFRIQILDLDGRPVSRFGQVGDGAGSLPRPKGVAVNRHGHVYTADAVLNGVQIFDQAGQLLLAMGGLGSQRGEFRLPMGIYIGSGDTIYVADSYNRRVQVFRYVGPS